ncbi:hypothetical protein JHK87_051388 [Glycine soja]|nr:hypothetical protein JHK87_051388 [Glycine soja]
MEKLASLEEVLLNGGSSVNNSSDPSKTIGNENLTCYSNAGFFSILTFSWISPLLSLGNEKTLDHEDLPLLAADDSAYGAFTTFRNNLESECGSDLRRVTTLKLVKVLIFSTLKGIVLSGLLEFLCTCASFVGPYLIESLVQYFNQEHKFKNEGYMLAIAFVAAKLVECLPDRHGRFNLEQVGVRMQSMLVAMIYAKGLTLSCQSKEGYSSGEIINLMTVDAERVDELCWHMHAPWICVLKVALAMLILYKSVGVASIAAFAATVIVMLLNLPVASLQEKFQGKIMEFKDKRMKVTSEILKNMKILKLQAWEMKFLSKIFHLRKTEETLLKKFLVSSATMTCLLFNAPTFIAVVTFSACFLIGIPLESGKILSALATFEILQMPIYSLPDTISMIAQTKVSFDRITSFLSLDDLQTDVVEKLPRGSSDIAIELVNGNFSWNLSSLNTTLKNINLTVFHGMRVAVCGTVASGKSSLLSCIIGEIPKISGTLKECLLGLLKTKTVIYITHQVEFLPDADLILVMREGRITQSGKYNDILRSDTDFMELVGAHREALSSVMSSERIPTLETVNISTKDSDSLRYFELEQEEKNIDDHHDKSDDTVKPKGQLIQEEEREKGRVRFKVYWKYITTAYGGAFVPFILLSQTLTTVFQIGSNYWMTLETPISATAETGIESFTLMVVYVALAIGSSFFNLVISVLREIAGYKTATILFNKMHFCFFRAPMSFFDATPSGRILNRASTDQNTIDISISYLRYYSASARELARLVGICQAPVIQHFSETISGSTTIRCFEQESRFNDIHMKLIDRYSQPRLYSASAIEWLAFRLDILSITTFAFCLVSLISFPNSITAPGIAGLAVTYGLNLNELQYNLIWDLCNLENEFISVERILQYTSIPSEAPLTIKDNQPDHSWPSFGEVHIQDLQVRYAPHLPLILRGLTCTFAAGAKTGIVGRTGSGKSTLALDMCQLGDEVRKKEGKLDSSGLIEEYDSPKKLLKNNSSSLAQLVAEYTRRSNCGFGT